MKDIQVAILFSKMNAGEDFDIFIPNRILYGETDEKRIIFSDYLSNQTYINSDIAFTTNLPVSFNLVVSLKELQKKYKTKKISEIAKAYLKDITKNAYFYYEKYVLEQLTLQEFYEDFGFTITYPDGEQVKQTINKFLNGEIDFLTETGQLDTESQLKITDMKISDICSAVNKRVLSQESAVKKIVTAIYRNNMFDDPKMKANIFVYGPTGVGKTEIIRSLGNMFDIPVLIEDMTRYTSAGYKGADLDDILLKLYINANQDLELAQRSILVLDEIDKKASDSDDRSSFQKDDVLKSLLKIIEGDIFDIQVGQGEFINFDTSKLTVITCGAFSDLYKKIKPKKSIGFNQEEFNVQIGDITESFVEYGIPIEFMGRMDTIVQLDELAKEDLVKILKEGELSPIKIYIDNLKNQNINIDIPDEIYEQIAEKAILYKSGARGLKKVVDEMFSDILFGIFDNPGEIEGFKLSSETVSDNKVYKLKRRVVEKNGEMSGN